MEMLLASVYILPIKECWIDKGLILFLWFGEDWCSARLIFFKTVLKNSFPERSHILSHKLNTGHINDTFGHPEYAMALTTFRTQMTIWIAVFDLT